MNRLSDFPLRLYRLIYAPCDLDDEPPMTSSVHDDLADIYGNIWHGLQALNAGDAAYAFEYWRDFYFYHWGAHASAAIYAIDEYYRKTQQPDADLSED